MNMQISERRNCERLSSGKIWEDKVGYSRVVRKGNMLFVAGTMGYDEDGNYPEDAGEQTTNAIRFIEKALKHFGASLDDVVRTRMYVTNIDDQETIGAAHKAAFDAIRPAATMVEVTRLAAPEAKIEIEVDAIAERIDD